MKPYILVVDDEPDIRHLVKDILEDEGYEVSVAESGQSARRSLQQRMPDLTLLDIWMPDVDGITLLRELHTAGYSAPVVMISGHGNVETAVEATRLGAFDFVEKPLSMGKLLSTVERAIAEGRRIETEPDRAVMLRESLEPTGHSDIMRSLRERSARVAVQTSNILLHGEPGTGKSLLAHYIHSLGSRAEGPFVSINLANVDGAEARRVLFGVNGEPGGAFARASHGTLYLNNINFADDGVQAELLDVLLRRRRSSADEDQDVPRVIVSASEDLNVLVAEGTLAKELYFQLNELPIWIPPLRDHREDVPDLLSHFVERAIKEDHLTYRKFSFAAQNWLRNYAWPGNVLELRNLVRSLLIMGGDEDVSVDEVRAILGQGQAQVAAVEVEDSQDYDLPLREARDRFEKAYLEYHLREANGNVGVVARKAGMERTHLYRKFRSLGIDPKNIRKD